MDIDGYLYADRGVLTEILDNIIANAVRYTDSGSVTVSAEKVGTEIQISVTDTGCGIPPEKQDLVFEEFVQLESSERLGGEYGMGLGLPLTVIGISPFLLMVIWITSIAGILQRNWR